MKYRKQTLMGKLIKKDKKVQYNTNGMASLKHLPEPDKFPKKQGALLNDEEQVLAGRRSTMSSSGASVSVLDDADVNAKITHRYSLPAVSYALNDADED